MSFTRVTIALKNGDDFPLEIPATPNMTHADVLQVAATKVGNNNKPTPSLCSHATMFNKC